MSLNGVFMWKFLEDFTYLISNKSAKILGSPYESDSLCSMAHRKKIKSCEIVFDTLFIFKEVGHCKKSYEKMKEREEEGLTLDDD